jgi:glycosidase
MLLAEANQWPDDVRPYFGDGDECHMAFHFPLMPRIFMALRQEDRHPITEILRRTPDLPPTCQWALFLRNHDELTLEMVTDGDRNGVRTPMQWSSDRNAGFSQTDPQRLYAPIIMDPVYGYQAINVESQQHNSSSLLWWMKRAIALRKQHKVFGRGKIEFLSPQNRKVLAYVCYDDTETILVLANLSRHAQPVELDLTAYRGMVPRKMFGRTEFPPSVTPPILRA